MDKLKVLVVGGLDQVGGSISKILNRTGFDVNVVNTSLTLGRVEETHSEIHAELSRGKYNLILLTNNGLRPGDIQALIPEIKRKHPDIKIIVLSGFSTPEFARQLMEQDIDDLLPLPFAVVDLIQTVTSIFDEENKMVKEAQKKLNWATLSFREKFRCGVIGYDGYNYRVSFSHRGRRVAIESIPRKEIDDPTMGAQNSSYLMGLLGWLEQVAQEKGKS
jgi:DNA-binding NtrC family response regulator